MAFFNKETLETPEAEDGGKNTDQIEKPAEPTAPRIGRSVKLDGDDIPEAYKGKTIEEVLAENKALNTVARYYQSLQNQPAPPAPTESRARGGEKLKESLGEEVAGSIGEMVSDMVLPGQQQLAYNSIMLNINSTGQSYLDEYGKDLVEDIVGETKEFITQTIRSNPAAIYGFVNPEAIKYVFDFKLGQNVKKLMDRATKKAQTAWEAKPKPESEDDDNDQPPTSSSTRFNQPLPTGLPSSASVNKKKTRLSDAEKKVYSSLGVNPTEIPEVFFNDEGVYADQYVDWSIEQARKTRK